MGALVDEVLAKAKAKAEEILRSTLKSPRYVEIEVPKERFGEFVDQLYKEGLVTARYSTLMSTGGELIKFKLFVYKGEYIVLNEAKGIAWLLPRVSIFKIKTDGARMKREIIPVCQLCGRRKAEVYVSNLMVCRECADVTRLELVDVEYKISDVDSTICYRCPAYYNWRCWAYDPFAPKKVKRRMRREPLLCRL